jgi:acyl carrier protein phosphodiesterase
MNFLAHVFLSGGQNEILVGNFIGDFVKGAQMDKYPEGIRTGIQLHRQIDHFTDTHDIVKKSKERLRPEFRHYSPVIVDVFYDHFLAKDWQKFSAAPLDTFTMQCYETVSDYRPMLPPDAAHMLTYMKRDNWLYNYRLKEGIHRALSGMAKRTPYNSKMEQAVQHLEKNYEEFANEFHAFFPDLQQHCADFLSSVK